MSTYTHFKVYCSPFFLLFIFTMLRIPLIQGFFTSIFPIWGVCLTRSLNRHKSTNLSYALANELHQHSQPEALSSQQPIAVSPPSSSFQNSQYHFSSIVNSLFFLNQETCKIFSLNLPPYQTFSRTILHIFQPFSIVFYIFLNSSNDLVKTLLN